MGSHERHGGAVKGFGELKLGTVLTWGRKRVLLGRAVSLGKKAVTRPPEQAGILPETPKTFHFLVSSMGLEWWISPVLGTLSLPTPFTLGSAPLSPLPSWPHAMELGLLWAVTCASPLQTSPFYPVDNLHLVKAGAMRSPSSHCNSETLLGVSFHP